MELTQLQHKKRKSILVKVPELKATDDTEGEVPEIRIVETNIANAIRRNTILNLIADSGIDDTDTITGLNIVSQVMCAMVTSDGDYLIQDNERVFTLAEDLGGDVVLRLNEAYRKLNPIIDVTELKK